MTTRSSNTIININYNYLIQLAKDEMRLKNYFKADYYFYLSLQAQKINLVSYINVMCLRSFIYYELKQHRMLLYLSTKLLKLFPLIIDKVNDDKAINDVVIVLSRTGIALYNSFAYCNIILPFYFLSVSKRLMQRKKVLIIDLKYKESFDTHYALIKSKLQSELKHLKQQYYDILTLNGEQFRIEEKESFYAVINELIKECNYDKPINNDNKEKEYFVISNKWLERYKKFLLKMNSFNSSSIKFNQFLNKGFDTTLQYSNFIEEDITKYDCSYINSVNNFWIEQFKDSWIGKNDDDGYVNVFLKSYITKDEYSLLNKNQWEELTKNFGYVNEIKRYKISNGTIEIHLKRIKVMVLNKHISDGVKYNLLRPKVIQLSREKTLNDLIEKINQCIKINDNNDKNHINHLYKINLDSLSIYERKQLIFEIMISYQSSNSSIFLKCEKLVNTTQSIESIEDKCLIIIEQLPFKSPITTFINEISNEDHDHNITCSNVLCKTNKDDDNSNSKALVRCPKCKMSLINSHWYCSIECSMKDLDHLSYHNQLSKYLILKTRIADLHHIPLELLISNNPKSIQGKAIINSTPRLHFAYINSVILIIAHCEELTKYILTERYLNEIKEAQPSKLLIEYNKLLKQIWNGSDSIVNANDFIHCLNKCRCDEVTISDASDFMTFLIDVLHRHLNRSIIRQPKIKETKYALNNKTDSEISNYYWRMHNGKEDSLISDLFNGQIQTIATCSNCNYRNCNDAYTMFNSISLDIPSILLIVNFFFVPLINNSKEKENKINLVYLQYDVTIKDTIKASDVIKVIIANNSHLTTETIEVDFILLKPNKQFDHLIFIGDDDISYILEDLRKGYQLILYQKTNKASKNIYVYPCEFITRYKLFVIPYIDITFLSYPIVIQMNNNARVNDLYVIIKKLLKKLFKIDKINQSGYKHFLFENYNFIMQNNDLFRLFIYNCNHNEDDYDYDNNDKWSLLDYAYINNKSSRNSTICSFCGMNCSYCSFSNRFNQNETIEYILSHCAEETPFVLYAQLFSVDKNPTVFNKHIDAINDTHSHPSFIEVKNNITLNDCLDLYFKERTIDANTLQPQSSSQCLKCFKALKLKHRIAMVISPLYLIINLKQNNPIEYPIKDLDLSKYFIKASQPTPPKAIYDLQSVLSIDPSKKYHSAIACDYLNQWLYASEDSISIEDTFEINSMKNRKESAIVLIYKLKTKATP